MKKIALVVPCYNEEAVLPRTAEAFLGELDRLDALAELLPRKAAELTEEMSDEGHPSPIYARIGEVIRCSVNAVRKP